MSGIHGLATTFGRIPFENHTDSVLIKAGPMSASAADAAITYAVMAPNDLDGFYSQLYDGGVHGPPLPHLSGFDSIDDLSDVRLGIYPEWFNDSDEKVRTRCYEVVDFLKSKGAQIVEIQIPHLQAVLISQGLKIASEFAAGWDSKFHNTPDSLEPNTRITVGIGSSASALEVLSGEKIRHYMVDYIAKLFKKEKLTAIINPTVGVEIPILTEEAKKRGESNTALTLRVMRHASFVNFLGLPGYTVPVGFIEPTQLDPHEPASTKVPVPFQFIGDHWSDHKLLRLGRAVEAGFTAKLEKPPRPLYYHDPLQV